MLINTARQLGTVLGTAVLTMILQTAVGLTALERGWGFSEAAALTAAVIAVALAVWWKSDADTRHRDCRPGRIGMRLRWLC